MPAERTESTRYRRFTDSLVMQFLAHRGFWKTSEQRNTLGAFRSALESGFGIETDVRDYAGEIVIAHDVANAKAPQLVELLEMAQSFAPTACLALNIKADGLRDLLTTIFSKYPGLRYFCFDMSVPETFAYTQRGLRFYTRESEFETVPSLYRESSGVWMDMFVREWITPAPITAHLNAGKEVAVVSPELHRRPHLPFWEMLRAAKLHQHAQFMLCTDFPDSAREFFNE